jgi:hypothetical protein
MTTTITINPEKPPTLLHRLRRHHNNAKMTAGGLPGALTTAGDSRRLLLDVGNTVGTLAGIRDAVFLGPEIQAALEDVDAGDDDLWRLGLFPTNKKRSRPLDE